MGCFLLEPRSEAWVGSLEASGNFRGQEAVGKIPTDDTKFDPVRKQSQKKVGCAVAGVDGKSLRRLVDLVLSFTSRSSSADPSSPRQLYSSPAAGAVPQIESLSLFRDVPVLERQALFLRKLRIFSVLFNFFDTLKSAREKEVKRQTLLELIDFVQFGSGRLNEQVQEELVHTVDVNIFCSLPPVSHENTGVEPTDPEEEDPYSTIIVQCLQNLPQNNKKFTFSSDCRTFNFLVDKEFVFLVVADEAAGRSVPFVFLERVKDDFMHRYGQSISGNNSHPLIDEEDADMFGDIFSTAYSLDREFGPRLKEHMEYCINHPEEMSKLSKLKAHITEVKGIMMDNLEKVLDRCGNWQNPWSWCYK
ncbi:serine/threonine protein phosphatase 2A 57 kDa regulatory subunit B' beta isoform-like [Zingiber officinale]|uniref:serine/threonine protein phosphatase 2A 57 kDa regulatory subunit B' beta isoform-like n=1 Tax=Zingiber officinale TaxID=94328 RepID=UPI001C4B24DC|nr:serine/threonine protein phosphatase 2A 57 kDa regulatory subunit B' beta isoform-like [Zingiber officinale]